MCIWRWRHAVRFSGIRARNVALAQARPPRAGLEIRGYGGPGECAIFCSGAGPGFTTVNACASSGAALACEYLRPVSFEPPCAAAPVEIMAAAGDWRPCPAH